VKIRIEGAGHCVEVEGTSLDMKTTEVVQLAEDVWRRTRVDEPRTQVGFGSQLVERSGDRPVAGNGAYEVKPDPVTS
jgi:hypothetical protein